MSIPKFSRLLRFLPKSDPSKVLIGEPVSSTVDVGSALRQGQEVQATVWSGTSALEPGHKTDRRETIERLLSPIAQSEVGTIRCIGLNYVQHAREVKVDLPTVPTLFLKPNTSLADPWPAPVLLPAATQADDTGDYESELGIIIGKDCKNVSESDVMDYVLGYTACNDISSRTAQFAQSQWCYSKGFDGSCPIGPVIVSKDLIRDPQQLRVRGVLNGEEMQNCGTDDLIFSVTKIVSFLSRDTTLPRGTLIITGTPAGVGAGKSPKVTIKEGDEFAVEILPHIGTLFSKFQNA